MASYLLFLDIVTSTNMFFGHFGQVAIWQKQNKINKTKKKLPLSLAKNEITQACSKPMAF